MADETDRQHGARTGQGAEALPIAPSLPAVPGREHAASVRAIDGRRMALLVSLCVPVAIAAAMVAQALTRLIGLITNLAFRGRWSTAFVSPAHHALGPWVVLVPVCGGLLVGVMARYGSQAIRGHGIPEAMEQILFNESRVPPRMTFLKPLSSAVAIGTGGPFGAEGPIIATGGALGSLFGQLLKTTADERKTLLAAGAGAGMAATFGSPVSAVLLAIELLLFEYRAASFIPVAVACTLAAAIRMALNGTHPIFEMVQLLPPTASALAAYVGLGALVGVVSVWVTRAVYSIEDAFERLPMHWMWWPALGGVAVGAIGYLCPQTMGVGYDNIEHILGGAITGTALVTLLVMKFLSWSISLGSGTSGGTLAPLFTIGGALGAVAGSALAAYAPGLGIDPRMAALVSMAAIFAGASQALLASVVFAFETTLQPYALLPLLGGCSAAYLVARLMMDHSIMTEKIARRGLTLSTDYTADVLASLRVRDAATTNVVCLRAGQTIEEVHQWIASRGPGSMHTGFPVVSGTGEMLGVVTRKDLFGVEASPDTPIANLVRRPPVVIAEEATVREALEVMLRAGVGRLPLAAHGENKHIAGIVTRSDLLRYYGRHLHESRRMKRTLKNAFLPG